MLIKAITVYQPWASLIALDEKHNETRGWYTNYRGRLAIHAAKTKKPYYSTLANLDADFNKALTGGKGWNPDIYDELPFGKIIAICNLVDCLAVREDGLYKYTNDRRKVGPLPIDNELAFGDYTPGRYALVLQDVKMLPMPISFRGNQGLWNWEVLEGVRD